MVHSVPDIKACTVLAIKLDILPHCFVGYELFNITFGDQKTLFKMVDQISWSMYHVTLRDKNPFVH